MNGQETNGFRPQYTFELLTSERKVVTWEGATWEEAARRAADCLNVTIIAWRTPRVELVIGIPNIEG
jgi:hypothetical protein